MFISTGKNNEALCSKKPCYKYLQIHSNCLSDIQKLCSIKHLPVAN